MLSQNGFFLVFEEEVSVTRLIKLSEGDPWEAYSNYKGNCSTKDVEDHLGKEPRYCSEEEAVTKKNDGM
jgi:hypothetical protein